MADFEEYSLMEKMVVGESLLWQLGMSRRWSTRANTWVVNGAPITANDFASRRLGVDVDNMPNGIMEYWLPKAMADLDGVEPERRLWLGDPSPATRTQTASDPPPDEQYVSSVDFQHLH